MTIGNSLHQMRKLVAVADTIKQESVAAVRGMHELGLHVVMITGDHPATADWFVDAAYRRLFAEQHLDRLDSAAICPGRGLLAAGGLAAVPHARPGSGGAGDRSGATSELLALCAYLVLARYPGLFRHVGDLCTDGVQATVSADCGPHTCQATARLHVTVAAQKALAFGLMVAAAPAEARMMALIASH